MRRILPAAVLLLSACVTQSGLTERQEANRWALANARTVGEPQNCIRSIEIRDTDVRDERTIDFELTGGRTVRSVLPNSCPGLAFDERFAYRTSAGGQLCSVDIITVLRSDGSRGASCGLGQFQPVEIASRPQD